MHSVNATVINLYHVCPRECWLHTNNINMEQTSDTVYDGKLLHETSYSKRANKYTEVSLSATTVEGIILNGKIDFYDAKEKIIHETKRSNKAEDAYYWQVKYYIWLFELNGIDNVQAILEYPTLRKKEEIKLTATDREYLKNVIDKIVELQQNNNCPPPVKINFCKSCSYGDFCWVGE
jgi:CRISPR-associated exonuclease Cas4